MLMIEMQKDEKLPKNLNQKQTRYHFAVTINTVSERMEICYLVYCLFIIYYFINKLIM